MSRAQRETGRNEPTRDDGGATPAAGAPRWRRYVAVGDSFTEGLWDVAGGEPAGPADDGAAPPAERPVPPRAADGHVPPRATDRPATEGPPVRGWADQLASHLSARRLAAGEPALEYANLAIRGRLLRPIVHEQVPHALTMAPDLVSVVGGGNDILRPAVDVDELAARIESATVRIRRTGADVLLATGMDVRDSPLISATRGRVGVYNAHLWSIARRHGAHVLDLWGMRSLRDWRMWADDRIHLSTAGHTRVAQAALVALGLTPDDDAWDDPLVPLPAPPRLARIRADLEWARIHVYPWATRRLRRRSSGDTRVPKRPILGVVEEETPSARPRS
ncbi:lipolytic protein G-D-S-L family [Beutenbergia cavernae DSM 12333]|uniref:Lipolytic protein G-D-S-L family n=1 Tax=Beutenbergia cavernae (strain ATCC BAA-8 / DSM 12333 / CCUG 43141 / JCM 11478 / NBRC 16432 / NCIMB 13614 / HKI 0122) TaxID=471853 RepID=C5BZA0_BEUC1|nr:SGNH/GDSL hydrolase family protein [Beutenbergia cavernae]ACQ79072.1 lipolytic protein G-D-S-L family [Beutenbergia cavernae DSM 12333]